MLAREEKIEKLVEAVEKNIVKQTEALEKGKHGNQYAKKTIKAFNELKKMPKNVGREKLSKLLSHERADVRSTVAAFLLRYKHEESMKVLKELARKDNFQGFAASECIKRWEEGAWQLDPEE